VYVVDGHSKEGTLSPWRYSMNSIARELLIEALSMSKVKVSKRVRERVIQGLCLIPGCECHAVGRGVCEVHKNGYYKCLSKFTTSADKLEFEQANIRKGLILPVGAQRSIKKQNESPFAFGDAESA
jgi:hypothetical protein